MVVELGALRYSYSVLVPRTTLTRYLQLLQGPLEIRLP